MQQFQLLMESKFAGITGLEMKPAIMHHPQHIALMLLIQHLYKEHQPLLAVLLQMI